ncbi:MAG TPA: ThiF family adenylyltransferase [Pirellulales bacterium]|nr:ThiF family adenylyltransferase [Pirellulales bacterium]
MSQKLVSLNPDLSQLRADGLDIFVGKSNHLFVRNVPYVNSAKEVKRGIIASVLDLAGETTMPPETHVVFFIGEPPCDENGATLPGVSPNANQALGEGLSLNHQISRVPKTGPNPGKFPNYYDKITTLVAIICSPAQAIDTAATPYTHPVVVPEEEDDSVFNYIDTAATKAGIVMANHRLKGPKIAIVGVGATGSYVLDFVAKTPVAEIHLFDRDIFLNHNAFRCPGAPSLDDLGRKQQKVEYLTGIYSRMRKKIVPHDCFIDETTVEHLKGMNFVFICIDKGTGKRLMVERLEEWGTPFVDVGMGIQLGEDNTLGGIVTVTTSTPNKRDHLRRRVAFADGEAANEYSQNVQIGELNALNAALAVIRWKKLCGYYHDTTHEHWCAYTIRSNQLISEDVHDG